MLAGTTSEELDDFDEQIFTAHMPLLIATGAFGLERRH